LTVLNATTPGFGAAAANEAQASATSAMAARTIAKRVDRTREAAGRMGIPAYCDQGGENL
jgi:hypothetical protein